jgi:hypothetical protein
MEVLQKLNFPRITLHAIEKGGRTLVYDSIRSAYIVLTPEEWVRRHVVEYLRTECGYAPQFIVEEHPIPLNGMAQRADIVVIGADAKPHMVVECKEPNVKIDRQVLDQVVRYNSVLRCKYIVMTNGIETYCYMKEGENYTPINHFPHCEISRTK